MVDNGVSSPDTMKYAGFQWGRRSRDLAVTLVLWVYFTAGFVVFFAPFYGLACLFSKNRAVAFQKLNCWFYRGFFGLCRIVIPRHKWQIQPQVRAIHSSVIVCNHISYLDSILLVSLFPRHTTIAKDSLFRIPIFGRFIALSGYIPSSGRGPYADLLLSSLESIPGYLEQGGNVIVFPEGTRSRSGRLGDLQKGAFKIAKHCKAPIKILKITNTNRLFVPGKFLFNTCCDNIIGVKLIADLRPDYDGGDFSATALIAQVHALLGGHEGPGNA